jgi:hypothetical protein
MGILFGNRETGYDLGHLKRRTVKYKVYMGVELFNLD